MRTSSQRQSMQLSLRTLVSRAFDAADWVIIRTQAECRSRRKSFGRATSSGGDWGMTYVSWRELNEAPRVHHPAELPMKARHQDKEEDESNGEAPLPAVSANTLARCLGVTPKIIYDLTKEGVIERGSGRLFQLEDSVRRYCEHLRRQTGGSS